MLDIEFRMTGIEFGITNIHLISNVKPRNKSWKHWNKARSITKNIVEIIQKKETRDLSNPEKSMIIYKPIFKYF